MTSKGHERTEEEERNSWGLKFTSLSPCSTGSPVTVLVRFVAVCSTFTDEKLVILNLPGRALCTEWEGGGWGGFNVSRE